jgi:hypothetical protein
MKGFCQKIIGALLIVAGILFLLSSTYLIKYDFIQFWPVLIVGVGLHKILKPACGCHSDAVGIK